MTKNDIPWWEQDLDKDKEKKPYKWMIESDANWMEADWGGSHVLVAGFLFLLYAIPMLIFVAIKSSSRQDFRKKLKDNHKQAYEITKCGYLARFMHLGGHPLLPYREWVLVGLKDKSIYFYDLYLNKLHN